ncbi:MULTISPECIES: hypothetical protein [unclassified Dysgonomonas]|nr:MULTISPECIES: hypothetical protein [unclassified Dysgonomonas]
MNRKPSVQASCYTIDGKLFIKMGIGDFISFIWLFYIAVPFVKIAGITLT